MYVCVCNAVTENMIRQAAADGVRSMGELTRRTGCAGSCGSCTELAEEILHAARRRERQSFALPLLSQAA